MANDDPSTLDDYNSTNETGSSNGVAYKYQTEITQMVSSQAERERERIDDVDSLLTLFILYQHFTVIRFRRCSRSGLISSSTGRRHCQNSSRRNGELRFEFSTPTLLSFLFFYITDLLTDVSSQL